MITELNRLNSLERVLKVDEQDIARCERKGIELGKINSPTSEELKLSNFEFEEKNKIEVLLIKVVNESNSIIKKLEQKKADIIRKLDVHIPKMQSNNEEKHQEDLEKFQKVLGEKSHSFKEVKSQYVEAQNELKNIKVSVNNRPLDVKLVDYYIPFMALLALSEVYINRLAFELFFQSSPIISILLASAIGGVLIFFAHITGESVKKAQSKEVDVNKNKTYLTAFFLNLFVLILVLFLALMRESYIAILEAEGNDMLGDLESLIDDADILTPGLSDVANTKGIIESLFTFSLGKHGFFLLLLNVAIYLSGTFAAFIRHDTHPSYEIAEKKYNKLRKEFFKSQKEFDIKISEIDKVQADKYEQISKQRDEVEEELYQIDKDISSYQSLASETTKKANQVLKERITAFREANKKDRTTPEPKYFKEVIKLNV